MMVETGVVVISGPLSSPRERGPDLKPRPHKAPRSGSAISTMICGRSVDAKQLRLRIVVKCCHQGTCPVRSYFSAIIRCFPEWTGIEGQPYASAMMAAQLPPPKPCPVCKVAMVFEPGDPSLGYDVFVCPSCGTKFLVHHLTPDDEDEDEETFLRALTRSRPFSFGL